MIDLKPCPFCGGKAGFTDVMMYANDGQCVKCLQCGARSKTVPIDLPEMKFCNSGLFADENTRYTKEQAKEKAAEAWNYRVVDNTELLEK